MDDDESEPIDINMKINEKTIGLSLFFSTVGCGIAIFLAISFSNSFITLVFGIIFGLTIGFISNYFILTRRSPYTVHAVKKPDDKKDDIDAYPTIMKLT